MGTMTNMIHIVEILIAVMFIISCVYIAKLIIEWKIYNKLINNYNMSPDKASELSVIKFKLRR